MSNLQQFVQSRGFNEPDLEHWFPNLTEKSETWDENMKKFLHEAQFVLVRNTECELLLVYKKTPQSIFHFNWILTYSAKYLLTLCCSFKKMHN